MQYKRAMSIDTDFLKSLTNEPEKIYLNVPYAEKDEVKSLGAMFDWDVKRWYYTDSKLASVFSRWAVGKSFITIDDLTDEQRRLIDEAKKGHNILVDACIGSGKTSTVQVLCNELRDKRILYLTYNKLLKVDAQEKIIQVNTEVTNYHGFAYQRLREVGITSGVSDLIQKYLEVRPRSNVRYDIMIIDEYQDIDTEIARMLEIIKNTNLGVQIIAVGDMKQKIYDKTGLNVPSFMSSFLGSFVSISFTKCFRISEYLARELGNVWEKEINGVNKDCKVEVMSKYDVVSFLAKQNVSDILCLGSRTGPMSAVLNKLEHDYGDKFNKKTVYASIRDNDSQSVSPSSQTAIFTTFDGAKGLERNICVVFDFTEEYWVNRVSKPMTRYEIIRNIFCVAASRGKKHIVFVDSDLESMYDIMSQPVETNIIETRAFAISDMFDFKYKEDIEECYSCLYVKRVPSEDVGVIDVSSRDELIDLSPCIGVWQEAAFFKNYDIDEELKNTVSMHPDRPPIDTSELNTVEEKILALVAYNTYQDRYMTQVNIPFITDSQKDAIFKRLSTCFDGSEPVQQSCCLSFEGVYHTVYSFRGNCDVVLGNHIYELKFKSDLRHEDFLQLACYLVASGIRKGYLWNIKTGAMYIVRVPDIPRFLDKVVYTITKHSVQSYIPVLS